MNTNRPFFSNFLSAFRARSGFQTATTSSTGGVSGASLTNAQKAAAASTLSPNAATSASTAAMQGNTPSATATQTTQASYQTSTQSGPPPAATAPRKASATTTSVSAHGVPYQRQHHYTSSYSRSPGTSPGQARGFRAGTISPASTTTNQATSRRRGSDSSTDGFREILGAEKWYIGGRTAAGEEKFYRLGMVRRPRSIDRLSADRLSL